MRRGVVALLVALVLAPEAAAKGDVAVALCGASGCAQVAADAPARSALAWPHLESVPPPPVGDFFRLRFAVRGGAPRVGYYNLRGWLERRGSLQHGASRQMAARAPQRRVQRR